MADATTEQPSTATTTQEEQSQTNEITAASLAQIQPEVLAESNPDEEIRTLFVAGLPPDVTPREIYLLFRPYEGYQHCIVKSSDKGGYCFAAFATAQQAQTAKDALQGTTFTPDAGVTINIEMAKHNTKRPREDIYSPAPSGSEKRQKLNSGQYNTPHWQNTSYGQPTGDGVAPNTASTANPNATPTDMANMQQYPGYGMMPAYPGAYGYPDYSYYAYYNQAYQSQMATQPVVSSSSSSSTRSGGIPGQKKVLPGVNNTLFVCNIGRNVQEYEIVELLKQCAGCTRIKPMHFDSMGAQKPICFVEFQDTNFATNALNMLNGYVMGNDHGALVVQYAKNKMTAQY